LPAVAAVQGAAAQPAANPQVEVRRDYELALQLGTREGWQSFLNAYPSGFYADLARGQVNKIASEEARTAATEKARQAEAEKARLAAAGAKAAEQAKAAREAKAAQDARIAAERQRQAEQAKAEAAERARAAGEKLATDHAEAEAKATRENAEADAKAAEEARKLAEKEADRLRDVALKQARDSKPDDKPTQLAALPNAGTALTPRELNRSLQAELRRVGCQTQSVSDEWNDAARRSLLLFNRHSRTKLEVKFASLDALDAVKGKQARVCPLVCLQGFRAKGDRCEKIDKKPVAKKDTPAAAATARQPSGQIYCGSSGCAPVPKGCRIVSSAGTTMGLTTGFQRIQCD
jgi:hypothetical protein